MGVAAAVPVPRRRVECLHGEAQAARRHPDLQSHPRGGLLLRRQDRLRAAAGRRRRRPVLPVAPPPVRQEPVRRHAEGAVRGQRAAVPGARGARRLGLVAPPPRRAAELCGGQLQAAGRAGGEHDRADRGHRTAGRRRLGRRERAGTLPAIDPIAARAHRRARRGAGGRVRQADSGRARRAGILPRRAGPERGRAPGTRRRWPTATTCAGSTAPSRTATPTSS